MGLPPPLLETIAKILFSRNPNLPESLHYNNPAVPNEYVKAITAVG